MLRLHLTADVRLFNHLVFSDAVIFGQNANVKCELPNVGLFHSYEERATSMVSAAVSLFSHSNSLSAKCELYQLDLPSAIILSLVPFPLPDAARSH